MRTDGFLYLEVIHNTCGVIQGLVGRVGDGSFLCFGIEQDTFSDLTQDYP